MHIYRHKLYCSPEVVGEEGTPNFPKDKSGAQRAIHRLSQRRTWGVFFFFVLEKKTQQHNSFRTTRSHHFLMVRPPIFDG